MSASELHFVVEVTPTILPDGTTQTFLFCSHTAFKTKPTDTPPNTRVPKLLKSAGAYKRSLFSGARVTGAVKPDYGGIVLANPALVEGGEGVLDAWAGYGISGSKVIVRRGVPGSAYPSAYKTVYIAYANAHTADVDEITILLRDRLQLLDTPVLDRAFLGTGGLEGVGSVSSKPRFVSSDPGLIPVVLVDRIKQIYQVQTTATYAHDSWKNNPTADINPFDVFDKGVKLSRVDTDYTSESQILSSEPDAGEVKFWFGPASTYNPSQYRDGSVYFRLGSPPDDPGDLRCYATGIPNDADHARYGAALGSFVFAHMALRAGIARADILDAGTPMDAVFIDGDETYNDMLSKVCLSYQAWYGMNRLDQFRSGYLLDPNDAGYTAGVQIQDMAMESVATTSVYDFHPREYKELRREAPPGMEVPIWNVTVSGLKTWPCPTANGATATLKDLLARDPWKEVIQGVSDTSKVANPGAVAANLELEMGQQLNNNLSKNLALARYLSLYGGRRDIYTFTCPMRDHLLDLDIHDVVTLYSPRFGLSAGVKFRIVRIDINCDSGPDSVPNIKFALWGGEVGEYTGRISAITPGGAGGGGGATPTPQIQDGVQYMGDFTQDFVATVDTAAGQGAVSDQSMGEFTSDMLATTTEVDPLWTDVVLLVRGTAGFADLSDNAITPTEIGDPTSVSEPDASWANSSVFRFVRDALSVTESAVSYEKTGGFLPSNTSDFTIEMFVQLDSALTWDGDDVDDRKSFLRLTDSGTMTHRWFGTGTTPNLAIAYPGQTSTGVNATAGRAHLAFCRSSGGTVNQAWVDGARVINTTGAPLSYNFDLVRWGNGNVATGETRQAQGHAEELRITVGARYDGATIAVPTGLFPTGDGAGSPTPGMGDSFTAADSTDPTTRDIDTFPAITGADRWRFEAGAPVTAGEIVSNQLQPTTSDTSTTVVSIVLYGDGNEVLLDTLPYFVLLTATPASTGYVRATLYNADIEAANVYIGNGGDAYGDVDGQTDSFVVSSGTYSLGSGERKVGMWVDSGGAKLIGGGAVLESSGNLGSTATMNFARLDISAGASSSDAKVNSITFYTGITLSEATDLTS